MISATDLTLNAWCKALHYNDVIMGMMASQLTSLTVVYSTVYSGADQRKHQNSASLASVRGIHRGPVNSPHKWPVTRKMFPFDAVIMGYSNAQYMYNTLAATFNVSLIQIALYMEFLYMKIKIWREKILLLLFIGQRSTCLDKNTDNAGINQFFMD